MAIKFNVFFEYSDFMLMEGSIHERFRREYHAYTSEGISYAGGVYEEAGRTLLTELYKRYMNVGRAHNLPILCLTPTWRANEPNCRADGRDVNGDCFRLVDDVRRAYGQYESQVAIGGLIGVKNDAYKPQEALTAEEAQSFHRYQIQKLVEAGVDFLIAQTIPALSEAIGIARAMAETNVSYIISFITDDNGCLLDGTPLGAAITALDDAVSTKPLCFMVNCVHPDRLAKTLKKTNPVARTRVKGCQGNASRLSPEELDGAAELMTSDPEEFALSMRKLRAYGLKAMGGCCGTDERHIEKMAAEFNKSRQDALWEAVDQSLGGPSEPRRVNLGGNDDKSSHF